MEIIIWKWLLHARQCDIELSVHGRVMKRNEAVRASYSKITQRTIKNESSIEMEMIRTTWDSYKRRRGLFYSYCFSSSTKVDPGKQSANLHRSSRQLAVNKSVIALVPPLLHTTIPPTDAAATATAALGANLLLTSTTTTTQVGQSFPCDGREKAVAAVANVHSTQRAWPLAHDSKSCGGGGGWCYTTTH